MRRLDVRSNGTLTADGAGLSVVCLQQSLLGEQHRQRDAAEPGASVVEETASVEQMMAVEWSG